MKISTNSFFYRQADKFTWEISSSLCVYFWQVVWAVLFWWVITPVLAVLLTALLLLGMPFAAGKLILPIFGYVETGTKLSEYLWHLGAGYTFFLVFVGLMAAWTYYQEVKPNQGEKPKKEENLFIAYVKAKKRKICPLIEFTEG